MDNNNLTLRAVIVDDEKRGISALKQLIEKFIPEIKVVAECRRPAEAISLIENMRPEVVFLDINMPNMNGFELLDKLGWKKFNLVFTTAYQEYGLQALKSNAIDYLLKPIDHRELRNTVEQIRKKLSENTMTVSFNYTELISTMQQASRSRMLVHSISGLEHIDPDTVIYLESQSNYTKIVRDHAPEVITRKTLKEFESQLCQAGSDFMRVHNSFIINLSKVSRYLKNSDEIVLSDELKVPLSKARRRDFFFWLDI